MLGSLAGFGPTGGTISWNTELPRDRPGSHVKDGANSPSALEAPELAGPSTLDHQEAWVLPAEACRPPRVLLGDLGPRSRPLCLHPKPHSLISEASPDAGGWVPATVTRNSLQLCVYIGEQL